MLKLENKMFLTISKFISRSLVESRNSKIVRRVSTAQYKLIEDNVEEIKIPVPWGHIAGKWWGNKLLPPVLAVHGWQDNANSFDRLIPLLNLPSVLAIDLPGHGLSSHLAEGKAYDFKEYLITLHRIKKYFNWVQMPLLTHSFGAALGYAYAAIFPNEVKWLINFECARAVMTLFRADICSSMSQGIDAFLKIEKQKKEKSPPVYTLSEMIKMSIEGSLGSISSPEIALVLLKRGIYLVDKPSNLKNIKKLSEGTDMENFITFEKQAATSLMDEEKENVNKIFMALMKSVRKGKEELKNFHSYEKEKYAFRRDPSIKILVFQSFDEDFIVKASKNIKCPVLSLRAGNGFLYGSTRKLYEKTLDILRTSSRYFEHHDINGTHHAHLSSPEVLAPIINNFIQKNNS